MSDSSNEIKQGNTLKWKNKNIEDGYILLNSFIYLKFYKAEYNW